jgi:hypothetical protein
MKQSRLYSPPVHSEMISVLRAAEGAPVYPQIVRRRHLRLWLPYWECLSQRLERSPLRLTDCRPKCRFARQTRQRGARNPDRQSQIPSWWSASPRQSALRGMRVSPASWLKNCRSPLLDLHPDRCLRLRRPMSAARLPATTLRLDPRPGRGPNWGLSSELHLEVRLGLRSCPGGCRFDAKPVEGLLESCQKWDCCS